MPISLSFNIAPKIILYFEMSVWVSFVRENLHFFLEGFYSESFIFRVILQYRNEKLQICKVARLSNRLHQANEIMNEFMTTDINSRNITVPFKPMTNLFLMRGIYCLIINSCIQKVHLVLSESSYLYFRDYKIVCKTQSFASEKIRDKAPFY